MRHAILTLATTGLALAVAGCDNKASPDLAAAQNGVDNVSDATANIIANSAADVQEAVTPTPTGQDFADKAAKSDAFEIAAAKLAQEKAGSADIKSFAAMMIKDHTASTAKIKQAAAEATPKITPDPTLTADQTGKLDALRKLSGADFDKEYASQQVDAHKEALALMQLYADKGEVLPLKTAAAAIAPTVQTHLEKITAINNGQ